MSRSRNPSFVPLAGGLLLILVVLFFLTHRSIEPMPAPIETTVSDADSTTTLTAPDAPAANDENLARAANVAALSEKLSTRLNHPSVRAHEAVLIFKNADGYGRFLTRAAQSGVIVAGRIDALNILRVRIRAYDTFAAELLARAADYGGVSANLFVQMPPVPEERVASRQIAVGNNLLATLGIPAGTDTSAWGRGVTIAVLDGGALPDPTLGARLRYLDIGLGYAGTGKTGLHGTAVASLAAGSGLDAPGVAPAASILSIRIFDTDDKSDIFTVTQGIVTAVDAGAQIINLSLGGYSTSEAINRAISYAQAKGVVIVAAAGNDGAGRLHWPAADPRVISVGSTDATGRQASFSNSGAQLHLTAPGIGIQAASLNNERTLFSGTSASAPIVSGALAALMSQSPGLTAVQAVEILQTHADDGGAAGTDANYGYGTLNLGWALARNDRSRVDVAVSSHHYNPETASLEVVVQNRSQHEVRAGTLSVTLNKQTPVAYVLGNLGAGQSTTLSLPIDAATAAAPISMTTLLGTPDDMIDAVPANNIRASLLDLSGR
ncbi:S8 family peptidase [Rariglobus hedericola]|uniref:S8 family serine peptidase n=1 Tax=Rariglobus hedericola TaxID=2597822 RepID=A0A556QKA2_9BACT|nr:S8 family serine peptidase [Rariglobus hedericola]TSJ77059.1 S8 family serine peptidase [Rariglobus hedericola]